MTLGHIFAKPKDPVKTNQKTHAVYSIPCGDCEKEYLGQSKRQFGTRLKEHQEAVSTLDKGKSALAEHVCYTKHAIAWGNSKVITTNNRYGQRLCLEAWHKNFNILGILLRMTQNFMKIYAAFLPLCTDISVNYFHEHCWLTDFIKSSTVRSVIEVFLSE